MQKKTQDIIIYAIITIYNAALYYAPFLLLFNTISNLNPQPHTIFIRQQLPFLFTIFLVPLQQRYMRNKSNRRKLQIIFGLFLNAILMFGYSFLHSQNAGEHVLMSFICINLVLLKINSDCMALKQLENIFEMSYIQTIGSLFGQTFSILMFFWVESNYFRQHSHAKTLSQQYSFWIMSSIGILLIIIVKLSYKQKMNISQLQLKHLSLLGFYEKYINFIKLNYKETRFTLLLFLLNQGNFIFEWSYYTQSINQGYLQYGIVITLPYAVIIPVGIIIYFTQELFSDQNKKYWIMLAIVNIKLILNLIFFLIKVEDDDYDVLSILYILINSILSFSLLFVQNYLCNELSINNHSSLVLTIFYLIRSLGSLMPLQIAIFNKLNYENAAIIGLSIQGFLGLFSYFWIKFLIKSQNLTFSQNNTLVTESQKINPIIARINK